AELGRGGVLLEVDRAPELSSGPGWRAQRGPWLQAQPMFFGAPNEYLDARLLPQGWQLPGFDDSGWDEAAVLRDSTDWPAVTPGPPSSPFTLLDPNPL